jgi:hypothetical protein
VCEFNDTYYNRQPDFKSNDQLWSIYDIIGSVYVVSGEWGYGIQCELPGEWRRSSERGGYRECIDVPGEWFIGRRQCKYYGDTYGRSGRLL